MLRSTPPMCGCLGSLQCMPRLMGCHTQFMASLVTQRSMDANNPFTANCPPFGIHFVESSREGDLEILAAHICTVQNNICAQLWLA